MRVKVIINARSGKGRAREQSQMISALGRRYGELDIYPTERPGHATELAATAVAEGYDLVAAAGGDGTVHQVVNGLMRGDQAALPLGIIPIGSGNDTAFGLGIHEDPEESVQRLFTGAPRSLDLARMTNEYGKSAVFVNNLGIGFDAVVVMRTETITRLQGFPMYFAAVLQTILFYFNAHDLEITFDEERINQSTLFLYGGLGTRGGGGFLLTPDARWDDDLIDTCLVKPIGRLRMLSMLSSAMKGTHTTAPFVAMRQSRRIEVKSSTPLPIQLDGEMFAYPQDNVRQLTIVSLPAAIQVMV